MYYFYKFPYLNNLGVTTAFSASNTPVSYKAITTLSAPYYTYSGLAKATDPLFLYSKLAPS